MKKTILAQKIAAAGKVLAGHPIRVQADGDGTRAEILIFDVIGEDWWTGGGVTAQAIASALAELRGADLLVRINCLGGDVVDGTAICNSFKLHDGDVLMRIEGWACSMATAIACAGDKVVAFANTMYMVHRASTVVWGNVKALRDTADLLDKLDGQLIEVYVAKTGQSSEAITALIDGQVDGTWMTAAEAKEHGFIDEVLDGENAKATALLDKAAAAQLEEDEGASLLPTAQVPDNLPIAAQAKAAAAKLLPSPIAQILGTNPVAGVVRMQGSFMAIGQDGVKASIEQTIEGTTDDHAGDSGTGDEQTTQQVGGDQSAGDGQLPADTTGKTDDAELEPADQPKEPADPVALERARAKAITAACAAAGLPHMAQTFIDQGTTVEAASQQLLAFKAGTDQGILNQHDSGLTDPGQRIAAGWDKAYQSLGR